MLNIFLLSHNVPKLAQYTLDIHIAKGILEIASVFFTIRNKLGIIENRESYKPRFINHELIHWGAQSYYNYKHIFSIIEGLNNEYIYRSNSKKNHKSFQMVQDIFKEEKFIKEKFCHNNFTFPYQVMPFIYHQNIQDYVLAYRVYYFFHKRYTLPRISWTKRERPYWYNSDYFERKNVKICDDAYFY